MQRQRSSHTIMCCGTSETLVKYVTENYITSSIRLDDLNSDRCLS